jgi:hypothetical protein
MRISQNLEITGCWVVAGLYRSTDENGAIFGVLCHCSTASVSGSFARHWSACSGLPKAS